MKGLFVRKNLEYRLHVEHITHQLIKRTTVFELQIMRANFNGIYL